MSDDEEYVSTATFTATPSAASIENTYRMAQVLRKRGDVDKAIDKYLLVCDAIERVLAMNAGARVEIQWVVLSLGDLGDIYYERQDYDKATAFRNCQSDFLEFFKTLKNGGIPEPGYEEDQMDDFENFSEVTSRAASYRKLFGRVREARELPDRRRKSPDELLETYTEEHERENQEKIDRLIRLFNAAADQQEKDSKGGCCVRMLTGIADHPFVFCLVVFVLTIVGMLIVKHWPKQEVPMTENFYTAMQMWDTLLSQYARNMGKAMATQPKQEPRPKTKQQQQEDDAVFSL